jgi:thiol-disulfide isomerase/thioredoxin
MRKTGLMFLSLFLFISIFSYLANLCAAAGAGVEVLIFTTSSCHWCEKAKPQLEQVLQKYGDKAVFIEADLKEASKYAVTGYPTYIVGGEKVVGYSDNLADRIGKIIEAKSAAVNNKNEANDSPEKVNDNSGNNAKGDNERNINNAGGNNGNKDGGQDRFKNRRDRAERNKVEDDDKFDFARGFENIFSNFFKELENSLKNLLNSFNKIFEGVMNEFEESLEESLKEITGGGKDGKNDKQDGVFDNKGNDDNTGRQVDNQNNGQVNKDDDFININNNNNGNVDVNDIDGGRNITSNPWDLLNQNKKPQPPKDNGVKKPENNNNGNKDGNKKFDNPFDELLKQQQRQADEELNKHKQTDNFDGPASEIAQKIREKFGVEIVNAEYTWTAQELKMTYEILSELPMSFVQKTRVLAKGSSEKVFPGMGNCAGFASGSSVTITPLGFSDYKRVLIHEMGHCFHFQTYELQNQFQQKFWSGRNGYSGNAGTPNPPAISQYGNSNVMEDMAEAIAYYVVYGKSMQKMDAARYELVKNLVMEGKEW